MKKILLIMPFIATLFLSSLIVGCTSKVDSLNARFAGKEVYICKNDYDIIPGKKFFKEVAPFSVNANQYNVYLSNDYGGNDGVGWISNKSNYIEEMEKDLISYPYCSKEEFEEYQARIKKAEEDRITKQKERVDDCKQAMSKAKSHHNEIKNIAGELMILDETITSNPENRTSNWNFCLKVMGHAENGIMVKSNCTPSPFVNLLLVAFIGCEDKSYFIYTSTKYADGECYKDSEYLHKDAGVYTWKGYSKLRAYQKTSYKVSEIDYITYLKDKSLKCCSDNNETSLCEE